MSKEFFWLAVALVSIVSSARLTRLWTFDGFPPVVWLRDRFERWTDKTDRRRSWQTLAFCPYCASFWFTLVVVLSGWGSGWHTAWWLTNGVLGASYLAAILQVKDGDEGEDS